MNKNNYKRRFPLYGWAGIFLVIVSWYLNWFITGLRTHWAFFPLWLGFCLTVDAIVYIRCGTSLIKKNLKKYISLFFISVPVWWLFELFNSLTHNWVYDGREYFTNLQFFILASISFSTVIPSVFEAAELAGEFKFIRDSGHLRKLKLTESVTRLFIPLGIITLLLEILLPDVFYPLIWITVFFLIEPINIKMNNNSLLKLMEKGDWRPVFSLWMGCLICAFFWEMWNYFSYPKWHYNLPMVNFLHIFEMPILGYIGYLPFSLELFAVYNFIVGIFGDKTGDYVTLNS
jgi:hypothetical protein